MLLAPTTTTIATPPPFHSLQPRLSCPSSPPPSAALAPHSPPCNRYSPVPPPLPPLLQRSALTDEELSAEVRSLEQQGHRRLLVLTGEVSWT